MKRLIGIPLVILTAFIHSPAKAGEYEVAIGYMEECWAALDRDYSPLLDTSSAPFSKLVDTYILSNPDGCSLPMLVTYGMLEDAGYFRYIEYRNDYHDRSKKWTAISEKFTSWRAKVERERPDIVTAASNKVAARRAEVEVEKQKKKQLEMENAEPVKKTLHEQRVEWIKKRRQCNMDAQNMFDDIQNYDQRIKMRKTKYEQCEANIEISEFK